MQHDFNLRIRNLGPMNRGYHTTSWLNFTAKYITPKGMPMAKGVQGEFGMIPIWTKLVCIIV